MDLSRTEVSFAVESRQCDPIFAVYNILLQEELKENNNRAPKTVSSFVIRDHSNMTRLAGGTAEKRRKMDRNETKISQTILHRSRLRSMQEKRVLAMKKRAQRCERYVSHTSNITSILWHSSQFLIRCIHFTDSSFYYSGFFSKEKSHLVE